MTRNHFTVLGLKPGASDDDVKKAYRALAKKFHPDKNKEAGAEDKFKEIGGAYEVLKNKDRREVYEREINRQISEKWNTVSTNRNADCLLKYTPIKHNKKSLKIPRG